MEENEVRTLDGGQQDPDLDLKAARKREQDGVPVYLNGEALHGASPLRRLMSSSFSDLLPGEEAPLLVYLCTQDSETVKVLRLKKNWRDKVLKDYIEWLEEQDWAEMVSAQDEILARIIAAQVTPEGKDREGQEAKD